MCELVFDEEGDGELTRQPCRAKSWDEYELVQRSPKCDPAEGL